METVSIPTTQNVSVDYELASIGDRMVATLIDYGMFVAYWLIVTIVLSILQISFWMNDYFFTVIIMMPIFLYDLVCEIFFNGKSMGKRVMNIKVIKIDGTQPSLGSYLLRWIFRIIDSMLYMWCIGVITILANGKGQRLGDIAARTTVIKTRRKTRLHDTILRPVDPNYQIVFPQVANLTDRDISIIKEVVILARKNHNWSAISDLTKQVKEVMGVKTNMPDFQFLNTITLDYSNYKFERN